jgi:Arc/MetJ-type ribon-helix-helix transcriptional regulator
MNWHDPNLYLFLCLLAGVVALLAIIYECMRRFRRRIPVLDGLQRDDQSGAADAESAREFRTVFNMTSQARNEAMIKNWMRRKGCSRSEAMRLAVEEWRGNRQREQARKREQEEQQRRCNSSPGNLSPAEAFQILGLKEGATEQQVRAAYYRLMKRAHPDVSGSDYFAKQLNGARDLLVG